MPVKLTRQEAAKELLARRKAREVFWSFCQYMDPGFFTEDKPHLMKLCEGLQGVKMGLIKKLMGMLPPRAGKSYTITLFCVWMLGLNPSGAIMRNCYGAKLAFKFSRHALNIIKSDKYKAIFPDVRLSPDQQAVEDWALVSSKTSAYFCAGVGGPITGKGCDLLKILDDPIKNLQDAYSETVLDNTWDWKLSTHDSRAESGCPEIIIGTRWSDDDPIGRQLEAEPGQWYVIRVPALDKKDRSFCEAVKTTKEYLDMRAITDEVIWEAEFQQRPIEAKGRLFPVDELMRFKMADIVQHGRYDGTIGYCDTADEGTNYLCSGVVRIIGGLLYLVDVIYTQEGIEITEGRVAGQIVDHSSDYHVVESNFGGKSFARTVGGLIENVCQSEVRWVPNRTNKETRILMRAGAIKKMICFRDDYAPDSEYALFMRHLTKYVRMKKGQNDDGPDMLTGIIDSLNTGNIRGA